MGMDTGQTETFFCACCDRDQPTRMTADARLAAPNGLLHRMCKQCDNFLKAELPFLTERIQVRKLRRVTAEDAVFHAFSRTQAPRDIASFEDPDRDAPKARRPRAASAIEKDLFHYHSLSVEHYIEGFIKGLEAAGLDRTALSREAETAVNNLLHISQTLAGERRRVQSESCNRADIRRLGRHIDDTSLMVNEYVRAVTEECLEPRPSSRYISSHGRDPIEQHIGADAAK